jgi:hypothetical protein
MELNKLQVRVLYDLQGLTDEIFEKARVQSTGRTHVEDIIVAWNSVTNHMKMYFNGREFFDDWKEYRHFKADDDTIFNSSQQASANDPRLQDSLVVAYNSNDKHFKLYLNGYEWFDSQRTSVLFPDKQVVENYDFDEDVPDGSLHNIIDCNLMYGTELEHLHLGSMLTARIRKWYWDHPRYIGGFEAHGSQTDFPNEGLDNIMYISAADQKAYYWDPRGSYAEIDPDDNFVYIDISTSYNYRAIEKAYFKVGDLRVPFPGCLGVKYTYKDAPTPGGAVLFIKMDIVKFVLEALEYISTEALGATIDFVATVIEAI